MLGMAYFCLYCNVKVSSKQPFPEKKPLNQLCIIFVTLVIVLLSACLFRTGKR